MNKNWSLIVTSLLCSSFSFAAPALNHYQFEVRVPATQQGCDSEVKSLVTAITGFHSNLQNVAGVCSDQSSFQENNITYSLDTLVVNYDAAAPIAPFKAVLQMSLYNVNDVQAVYMTYADCLADIATQESNFTAATGLSALAASCELASSTPDSGYSMTVQGLGDASVRLFQFQNDSEDSIATDATWLAQIEALLKTSGASITKQVGESFFYYANDAIPLVSRTLISTDSDQECEAQRDQANALLTATGAKNIITACHTSSIMGENLDYVVDSYDNTESDYGTGSTVYYSFASCMTEQARLQAQAIANGDHSSYLFCISGDDTGQYKIETVRSNAY